jgi:hypothetical protein
MSAHDRLAAYGVALEIGRRLAADPAVRAAARATREARVRLDRVWRQPRPGAEAGRLLAAYTAAGRVLSAAAAPYLPAPVAAWASEGAGGGPVLVLWTSDHSLDLGYDLHLRALERGEVLPVRGPSGSGECVGI